MSSITTPTPEQAAAVQIVQLKQRLAMIQRTKTSLPASITALKAQVATEAVQELLGSEAEAEAFTAAVNAL